VRNRIGDDELRQLFENFGQVQSCIVNQDKRHAFIKMLTREDAVKAKAGMETYKTDNMTLRVRAPKCVRICGSCLTGDLLDSLGCWFWSP
jgi:hypothetical protein